MTEHRTTYNQSVQYQRNQYRAALAGIVRYIRSELGGHPPSNPDTILYQVYVAAKNAIDDNARSTQDGPRPSKPAVEPVPLNGDRGRSRAPGASRGVLR